MKKSTIASYRLYRRNMDASILTRIRIYKENRFLRMQGRTVDYYVLCARIAGTRHNQSVFLKIVTRGVKNKIIGVAHAVMLLESYWQGWDQVLRLPFKRSKAQRKAVLRALEMHIVTERYKMQP